MGNCCIRPFKQTSTASAASTLVHGDTASADAAARMLETVASALRSTQLGARASAGEREGEQAALTDELISRVAEQTRQTMGNTPAGGSERSSAQESASGSSDGGDAAASHPFETPGFEGLGDAVPNKLHFVWVGRQISQENLQLAQHYAARGANVSLWTDNPQGVVRTSTSMHHQYAGSLDSSVPMGGVPAAAGEQGRTGEDHWIAIRSVEQTFEGDPSENGRALNRSQIQDGAGLGNPGARSDAVRYQVLFREGGVYTDFDRAEALRHNAIPHGLQRAVGALRRRSESGEISRDDLMKELKERYGFETKPFPSIEGCVNVRVGMNYAWRTHPLEVKNNDLLAAAPNAASMDRLRGLVKDTREANAQSKPLRFDDPDAAFVLSNAATWMSLDDKFQEMLIERPGDARQALADEMRRLGRQGSFPSREELDDRLETLRAFIDEKSDEAFSMWRGALQAWVDDPSRRMKLESTSAHPSRADQMRDPATWHELPQSRRLALDEIRQAIGIANTLGLDLSDHHPKSVSDLAATLGIRLTMDTTGPGQISRLVDELLTHFDRDQMPRLFDRSGLEKRLGVSAQTLDIMPSDITWAARTRDQYPAGFEAPEAGPSKRSARGDGFEIGDPPGSSGAGAPADRARHAGRLEDFFAATRSDRPPAQERSDRGKGKQAATRTASDAAGGGATAAAPPAAGIRIREPSSPPEVVDAQGRPFTDDTLRSRIGQQLDVKIHGRAHSATVRMMALPGGESLPVLATRHPDAPVGQQQRFTAADGRRFDAQHVAESADGQLHYTALSGGASRGKDPVAPRTLPEEPRLQGGPDAPSSSSQPQRQQPGTREIEPQPPVQASHAPAPSSAQAAHSSSATRTQRASASETSADDALKHVGRFLADTRRGYAHKEMLKNAAIDFVVSATGTIAGTLVSAMRVFDTEVVDAGKATDGTPPRLSPAAQPIEPGTDITYVSGVLGSMTDGAVLAVMKEVVRRFGLSTSYQLPKVGEEAKDALRALGATDPSEWGQQFHEQMRRATPAQALALAKEANALNAKEDSRLPHIDALARELNEFAQAKVANFYRRPGHVDERYLGRRDQLTNGALQSMLDLISGTGDRYKSGSPSMQASRLPTGHGPGGKDEPPAKLSADRHANTVGMFMPALANGMRAFMELGAQSYFLLQKLPSIKPGQSESDWWSSILKSGKSPMAVGALAASLAARAFVNAHQMQSLGMVPKQGGPYDKAKQQHALPQRDVETGQGGRDTAKNASLARQIADLKALAQTLSDPKAWLKAGLDNIGYKGLISAIRNQIGETRSPATKLSPASAWGNTAAVIGSALLGKAFEQIWAGAEKLLQRMRGSTDGAGGEPQAPRLQDVRVDQADASDGSSSSTSRGSMPVSSVDTQQMHEALDWMRKALERLAAAFNAPSPLSSRHGIEDSDSTSRRGPHSMDSFWTSNPLFQSFERSPSPDDADDDDVFFDAHETPQSEAQERGLSRAGGGHHEATGGGDDGHSSPTQPGTQPGTAPQAGSMRELFAQFAQAATRSEEPAGSRSPPASPTGDEPSNEPLPVPNRLQTIWFGRPISQEDLTTLLHFAARGGNVNLWTDDYRKAIRQDASRHSPAAGDLHSSIPIAGYPTHADPAATNPRQQLALRDVSELMASPDFRQAVVRLMAELVGLGNPGAASDVARYLLLQQEGGIYMDLDRAEQTKPKLSEPNHPIAPDDLSAPHPGGLKHPIESAGGSRLYPNDLLIAAPHAQAIQQAIDRLIEMDRLLDRGAASQDINNNARQPTSTLDMLIFLKMNLAQQVEATQSDNPPTYERNLKDQGRDPKVPQQVHDRMTVLSTGPNVVRDVLPRTEAGKQQASDLRDLERLLHLVEGFLSQPAPQTLGWAGREHPSSLESPLAEGPGRARQWEAASRGGNGDEPDAGGTGKEPAAKRRRLEEPRSEAPGDASPPKDKGKGKAPAEPQQPAPRADGEGPSGAHEPSYQTRHVDQSEIPDVPEDDADLQPKEPSDEEVKRGGGRKDPATGRYHYDGKADAGEASKLIAGGATADRAQQAAAHIQSEEQLQNVLNLQTYSDGKLSLGQAVALSSQIGAAQDPSWVGTKAAWVGELVAGGATGDEAVQAVNTGKVTSYDDVTEAVAAMGQGKTAGEALGVATAKSEGTESEWAGKLIDAGASSTQANAAVMNIQSEEQLQNVLNLHSYSDGKLSLGQAVAMSSQIDPAKDPGWVGTKAAWVGEMVAGGITADAAVKAVNSGAVNTAADAAEAAAMTEMGTDEKDALRLAPQIDSTTEATEVAMLMRGMDEKDALRLAPKLDSLDDAGEAVTLMTFNGVKEDDALKMADEIESDVQFNTVSQLMTSGVPEERALEIAPHVTSDDQLSKLVTLIQSGGYDVKDVGVGAKLGEAVDLSSKVGSVDDAEEVGAMRLMNIDAEDALMLASRIDGDAQLDATIGLMQKYPDYSAEQLAPLAASVRSKDDVSKIDQQLAGGVAPEDVKLSGAQSEFGAAQLTAIERLTKDHGYGKGEAEDFVKSSTFKEHYESDLNAFDSSFEDNLAEAATLSKDMGLSLAEAGSLAVDTQSMDDAREAALLMKSGVDAALAAHASKNIQSIEEAKTLSHPLAAENIDPQVSEVMAGGGKGSKQEIAFAISDALSFSYQGKQDKAEEVLSSPVFNQSLTALEISDAVFTSPTYTEPAIKSQAGVMGFEADLPKSKQAKIAQALTDAGVDEDVAKKVAPYIDDAADAGKIGSRIAGMGSDAVAGFKKLASLTGEALPESAELFVMAGIAIALAAQGKSDEAGDFIAQTALGMVLDPTGIVSLVSYLSGDGNALDADAGAVEGDGLMQGIVKGADWLGDGFTDLMNGLADDHGMYNNLSESFKNDKAVTSAGASLTNQQAGFWLMGYGGAYEQGGHGYASGLVLDGKRATSAELLDRMREDGMTQDIGGKTMVGFDPQTEHGKEVLATAVLRTGTGAITGSNQVFGEQTIDAEGLKTAIDAANGGADSITEEQAQMLVQQYDGDGDGRLNLEEIKKAVDDKAIQFGQTSIEVPNEMSDAGTSTTPTIGLKVNPKLSDRSSGEVADLLLGSSGDQVDGEFLVNFLRNRGNFTDTTQQLSSDQAQFIVNAYSNGGSLSKSAIEQMIHDGVLRVSEDGDLTLNSRKFFNDLKYTDVWAFRDRAADAFIRSGESSDGTLSFDEFKSAYEKAGGTVEDEHQLEGVFKLYAGDDVALDRWEARNMIADGVLNFSEEEMGVSIDARKLDDIDHSRLSGMIDDHVSFGADDDDLEMLLEDMNLSDADIDPADMQTLIDAYDKDGDGYAGVDEIKKMLDDGALKFVEGKLTVDRAAISS